MEIVMSFTPITSNFSSKTYTVIGDKFFSINSDSIPISIVILNRGPRIYRESQFLELQNTKFSEILSVEPPDSFYEIESFTKRFEKVRFIVPNKELSIGESINLAIDEAHNPWVLVLWNNMSIPHASLAKNLFQRVLASDSCFISPFLCNHRNEVIPSICQPALYKKNRLKTIYQNPGIQNNKSIFPFDFCGFYNKSVFKEIGGFDITYKSSYWQLLDFGFRAYMWGRESSCELSFRLLYIEDIEPLNTSINREYAIFFNKNLAIRIKKGRAYLPVIRFLGFNRKVKYSTKKSWVQFCQLRKFVHDNRLRYKKTAYKVVDDWQ